MDKATSTIFLTDLLEQEKALREDNALGTKVPASPRVDPALVSMNIFRLSWRRRITILRDVALALAQCHEGCLDPLQNHDLPRDVSQQTEALDGGRMMTDVQEMTTIDNGAAPVEGVHLALIGFLFPTVLALHSLIIHIHVIRQIQVKNATSSTDLCSKRSYCGPEELRFGLGHVHHVIGRQ